MRVVAFLGLLGAGCSTPGGSADSDTGDSDSLAPDSDSEPDTDPDALDTDPGTTGDTGSGAWHIAYPGQAVFDPATGAWQGSESAGIYLSADDEHPDFGAWDALCEFTWQTVDAATSPPLHGDVPEPDGTPCPGCAWTVVMASHGGVETGPPGGCASWGIDAELGAETAFGYGFHPAYTAPDGTELGGALMVFLPGSPWTRPPVDPLWVAVGPATFDPYDGAFRYLFLGQIGYL